MADAPVVHIGENSPEQVAYKLFCDIAYAEDKKIFGPGGGDSTQKADRKWIFSTYRECLYAVRNHKVIGD